MDDLVYNVLYSKVNENCKLDFNKDIGNRLLNMPIGKFDVLKVVDLENSDFVKALYLGMLNRNIDDAAHINWSRNFSMDSRKFKKLALNKIIESKEFKDRNIIVINNIFNDEDNESNLLNISKVKLPFKIILKQKIRYILKYSAKYLNPLFDNEFGSIIKDKIKRTLE